MLRIIGIAGVALLLSSGCALLQKRGDEEQSGARDEKERPDLYEFHRSLGMLMLRTLQPRPALSHFRRLESLRPESAEPPHRIARAYLALNLRDSARASVERALELDPEYAPAHALRGVLLDTEGRHELAEEAHRKAVRLAPRHAAFQNNLGFNLHVQNRHSEALEAYREALALEPSSRRIHNNLGFLYGDLGDTDRAWRHFREAGAAGEAKNNLGLVYEERGDRETAYRLYREAAEHDPDLAQARGNLARLREASGRALPENAEEEERR